MLHLNMLGEILQSRQGAEECCWSVLRVLLLLLGNDLNGVTSGPALTVPLKHKRLSTVK